MPKKHEEEHENHERWLVSYADFITLLFAFFTVLYATSQKDVAKAEEFQRSVQKAFRSFIDFGGLMGKYVGHNEHTQIIPPAIDVVPQEGPGPEEILEDIDRSLQASLGEESKEMIELNTDSVGVRVSLAANSFFDSGNAYIRRESLKALDLIAKVLRKNTRPVLIEGHTDSMPISTEQFPSNWELSSARASTIVRYFVERHMISPKRMAAIGYADQRPIVPNDTEQHRARNRRIDILIVSKEK